MNIYSLTYKLFLFDFDGTIIDSEKYHFIAYKNAFKKINNEIELSYDDYCKYKHKNDALVIKKLIENNQIDEQILKKIKEEEFVELIKLNGIKLIDGFENFLQYLVLNNKQICVVTNSSKKRVNMILDYLPQLNKIKNWITSDDVTKKKPHPECYIKAISIFNIKISDIIIFEDSYNGFKAIKDIGVDTVLINSPDYIFYNEINCKNKYSSYNSKHIIRYTDTKTIDNKIKLYIEQYKTFSDSIVKNVNLLTSIVKMCEGIVYFAGIGKNNHLCAKIVSTWQSLGIRCNSVYVQDLSHGDFGIFGENDYIVHVSNSGNTLELLNVASYIKKTFGIYQISLTNSNNCKISEFTDIDLVLGNTKIIESDKNNMAPTVSTVLFMTMLDLVGVNISEKNNFTIKQFKRLHPGGALGKQIDIQKPLDCVFIFASGYGSRLRPLTNYIPKVLVNVGNKNILAKIVDYWTPYAKKINVVVNECYKNMVEYYLNDMCTIDHDVICVNIKNDQGNIYTISNAIHDEYINKKILITWCDIYPGYEIPKTIFGNTNIIFTHGNECRYIAENNKIYPDTTGNVIGIYYFSSYKPIICDNEKNDLCDSYTMNYKKFTTYDLPTLIDIGDKKKLDLFINESLNKMFCTRSFNSIEILSPTKLIKKSLNDYGNSIITNEMNWYKNINVECIPKIFEFSENYFIMEKLDNYNSIDDIFDELDVHNQKHIISKIFESLSYLHINIKKIDINISNADIEIEFFGKIIKRTDDIQKLLDCFGKINYVNGSKIDTSFKDILDSLYKIIKSHFSNISEYAIIHGDCQFNNTMINKSLTKICFIDPRGYFGNTKIYGPKEYDYSKVLYALSGYGKFNSDQKYFIKEIVNGNMIIDIENRMDEFIDIIETKSGIGKKILISMVIIHWLGLAQYNKNNILKCISAHYYGIYLYNYYKYLF
jgi:HAD superfamily hydrolase (TIGR01509 family)